MEATEEWLIKTQHQVNILKEENSTLRQENRDMQVLLEKPQHTKHNNLEVPQELQQPLHLNLPDEIDINSLIPPEMGQNHMLEIATSTNQGYNVAQAIQQSTVDVDDMEQEWSTNYTPLDEQPGPSGYLKM